MTQKEKCQILDNNENDIEYIYDECDKINKYLQYNFFFYIIVIIIIIIIYL